MASQPTGTPIVKYAALSHCWGGADDILKLKSENLDQLLQPDGVNIQEDLPKTFQHAITICRELEIPCLWIDSLCIIQDSKDDWARESSVMGEVYSKATLTIAATGSETSNSGIFFRRAGQEPKLEFHIPGNPLAEYANYGNSNSLSLVPQNWELTWHINLDNASPLNDRGWTFQERLLSRRILHFGHLGIAWECETQCASEFAHGGYPADNDLYLEGGSGRPTKPTCFLATAPNSRLPDEVHAWDAWIKFVEAYSQRSLTFSSDRLVAISAIARAMQHQLGDSNDSPSSYCYNAGLWRSTLLPELCWIVDWSLVSTATVPPVSKSSEPEGGPPSWSWGSTSHPVFFPFTGALLQERFTRLLVRLVHVETTPLPSFAQDPFGQVSGGVLTLKGRLIPVRIIKLESREQGQPKEALWKLADADTGTPIQPAVWVSRDNEDLGCSDSSIGAGYYILPVMHRLDECSNAVNMMLGHPATGPVQGLLLEKVENAMDGENSQDEGSTLLRSYPQYYRRVGSFFIQDVYSNDAWFGFGQVEDDAYDEAMGEEAGPSIKII